MFVLTRFVDDPRRGCDVWPGTVAIAQLPPPADDPDLGSQLRAARLHHRHAADDAAAAALQERVSRDAPLRPSARRGRLRRPGRGFLRPRLRRADRARVPLRPDARPAGRHPPHERPDDRVLRAVQRDAAARRPSVRPRRHRVDRRHEQLPRQLLARHRRRRSSRELGRAGAHLLRADLGQQHQPAARASWPTTTTRSCSASARASGSGRRCTSSARSSRGSGYDPGRAPGTFGIEKRAGGHTFQLNFSNGFGTTMGQIARGGTSSDDWYLGFNISRKFY